MARSATVYSDILDGGTGRVRCQLVVVDGPDRGRACRLGEREVAIGTGADCELVLSDDRVSSRHVSVHAVEARFVVRDLGSTNGTWYEGSRITEVTISAGSTLLVGKSALRIEPEAQPLDLPPSQARRFGDLVGESLAMREVFAVLGLGVHDGGYYVVMEYVDGHDLARHLDGALSESLALHVVHELALGLRYLHAATDARGLPLGLVHRDVSPANTLVSSTGDVKLGDFGIAKATAHADLTAAGTRKGRYAYMAPEQLAGEPVTAAADQFGLAVMLVELVTGARPFAGETPWALLEAVKAGPRLDALAPDLAAIAGRALAVDARDRFASTGELAIAIAAAQLHRARVTADALGAWVSSR